MLSHITGITRLNEKGKYTLIDNIYFNNIVNRSDSGNLLCPITDHLPNFLIIKTGEVNKNNSKATSWDFSRYNTCLYMISEMKISQVISKIAVQLIKCTTPYTMFSEKCPN